MNEFYIHTFSNACTKSYPGNTLTNFQNDLPISLELPQADNWHVCVKSIGFSSNFPSIFIPKSVHTPCISIYRNPPLGGFQREAEIYFPSKFSDINTIKKSLEIVQTKNIGIEFVFNEDKNIIIRLDRRNKDNKHYALLIHEIITSSFGLPKSIGKRIMHANEVGEEEFYYKFDLTEDSPSIHGYLKRWNHKHPDLVRIQCEQISEQNFNGKLSKDLMIFCPSFEKKEKYTFYEFDCEEYAPLSNSILDKLSVKLFNEKDEQLELDYGVATFVKFKFKKMVKYTENFNVRLSPGNSQSFNNFSIDLPQAYYLDSDWKVALSSISYANIFRPLPFEARYRKIYTADIGGKPVSFVLKNLMYTNSGLISELNRILKYNDKVLATIKFEEFEENGERKKKVIINVNPGSYILFPSRICEILGFDPSNDINDDYVITKGNSVCLLNTHGEEPVDIRFSNFFDINRLNPEYLMVYTDIIDQAIIGNTFSKLLKIVPVFHNSTDSYKTQEFKNREYHSLESTLVKKIKVEIRSHSGDLINFVEDSKIFMNILFSK